ncbi:MAG: arsenic efflux protein [Lachnospiraceae bacterium]|nr:arsenic efflux protein [Lachnospiraceae bacterium]
MADVVLDTVIDSLKLLPFLLITYILMEYVEHKAGGGFEKALHKGGAIGPLFGGVLGVVPQCGFSAAASNLYAGRIISLGTLFAVYLSTSDEMLPILISEQAEMSLIIRILVIKAVMGIATGFIVDLVLRLSGRKKQEWDIESLCEREHCSCEEEEGIIKPALVHTFHVFIFVFFISFALNTVVHFLGEDVLRNSMIGRPVIGEFIAALIGLIPNCGASVALTSLYLEKVMSAGAMMSGLLTGAGVGLLVLFRVNDHMKENLVIAGLLYIFGVLGGIFIEFTGLLA